MMTVDPGAPMSCECQRICSTLQGLIVAQAAHTSKVHMCESCQLSDLSSACMLSVSDITRVACKHFRLQSVKVQDTTEPTHSSNIDFLRKVLPAARLLSE